jgi:hypothetical protein
MLLQMAEQPRSIPQPDPVAEAMELLGRIQAAIGQGDAATIRQSADALKGSITSLLAKQAFEAASAIENTLREEDLAQALEACRRLHAALTSLTSLSPEKHFEREAAGSH